MMRRASAAVLAGLLVAGCGGHTEPPRQPAPTAAPPAVTGLPGELVEIGDGRSLFVHCVGSGDPTIILEAGFGADGFAWRAVQPLLKATARSCAYDRAGFGSSVGTAGVRDVRDELADLRALLSALEAEPPYVLVGHSYGGLLARLYAHEHPGDVAGLVQVDAKIPDQFRRQLAIWPKTLAPRVRREVASPVRDNVDLAAGDRIGRAVTALGDLPQVVVTAGRPRDLRRLPRPLGPALARQWMRGQDELAALSSDSIHVVALRSDHSVQLEGRQPEVVARAVETVVAAARDHHSLPPCARVFRGRDVRCRPSRG